MADSTAENHRTVRVSWTLKGEEVSAKIECESPASESYNEAGRRVADRHRKRILDYIAGGDELAHGELSASSSCSRTRLDATRIKTVTVELELVEEPQGVRYDVTEEDYLDEEEVKRLLDLLDKRLSARRHPEVIA